MGWALSVCAAGTINAGTTSAMKRTLPLQAPAQRQRCPVCGEASYSRAGIHPQCAQRQADAKRMARCRSRAKAKRPAAKPTAVATLKAWHKLCPRCRTQIHIRKSRCACGHDFQRQAGT